MRRLLSGYWIAGIVTAGVGLLLARIVSRLLTEPLLQVIAYIAGVALALAGLVIIVFGISKRRRQT